MAVAGLFSVAQRSPIRGICVGVLRACRVYSFWWRHPQLCSGSGPITIVPWTFQTPQDWAGGKGSSGVWRVSSPIQNHPAVQTVSQTPVKPVSRRSLKPNASPPPSTALKSSRLGPEVMPATVLDSLKSASLSAIIKPVGSSPRAHGYGTTLTPGPAPPERPPYFIVFPNNFFWGGGGGGGGHMPVAKPDRAMVDPPWPPDST